MDAERRTAEALGDHRRRIKVKKGKPATKRKAPVRATEERWRFKIVTNDGKHRIESNGTLFTDLGESLRTLQMHIGHLARSEQDTLYVLAAHIRARLENEKKSK